MNYNASTDKSLEKHAEFVAWLSSRTVAALKNAQGDAPALREVVQQYLAKATAASLSLEEMENIFGVHEPSIMDLAELSDEDEETVIDTFEQLTDAQ